MTIHGMHITLSHYDKIYGGIKGIDKTEKGQTLVSRIFKGITLLNI